MAKLKNNGIVKSAPRWPLYAGAVFIFVAIALKPELPEFDFFIFNKEVLLSLFKEIGFALVIAWCISASIERLARNEQNEAFFSYIRESGENIISAVFGVSFPKNIFEHIVKTILNKQFIRRNGELLYEMRLVQRAELQGLCGIAEAQLSELQEDQYVFCRVTFKSDVENIFNEDAKYPVIANIEVPAERLLRACARLERITVDGVGVPAEMLRAADNQVADDDRFIRYLHEQPLPPRQSTSIEIVYTMIKYCRDYEVWRTAHTLDKVAVTVMATSGLEVKHAKLHPTEYRQTREPTASSPWKTYAWEQREPLLPQQGIILWWFAG